MNYRVYKGCGMLHALQSCATGDPHTVTAMYRWIGVWSEFIGDLVILFSALFAVLGRDALSPGLVGLSLSFALQVP